MRHGESWPSEKASTNSGDMESPHDKAGVGGCPVASSSSHSYYRLFDPIDGDTGPIIPENILKGIADNMTGVRDESEGEDNEGIPAGYTYFGQFVIHDLTRSRPTPLTDAEGAVGLKNLRTPRLDLDSLYGNGPDYDLHLYQRPTSRENHRYLFHLGKTAKPSASHGNKFKASAEDLPRLDVSARGIFWEVDNCFDPIVADPRNDDNLILSQLTALFLRIHNHVASVLKKHGKSNEESFEIAREFMVKSYRRIVVHDFLKRLLSEEVHKHLTSDSSTLFDFSSSRHGLPLEFVFGVGRIGHAMVRDKYRINEFLDETRGTVGDLLKFSSFVGKPELPLPADWRVNWSNFFEASGNTNPQRARRISPFWPILLNAANHSLFDGSLMLRDLARSGEHLVLSGQRCALALQQKVKGAMNVPVLEDEDLTPRQTIPPVDTETQDYMKNLKEKIQSSKEFMRNTPLLYYVVQEAAVDMKYRGLRLGPLGSYIFAFTIGSALAQSCVGVSEKKLSALNDARRMRGVYTMPKLIEILDADDGETEKDVFETIL